ncbi:MAG TPA: Ppx/GppA family phosphatase [Geminicoccus sp.]|uniref:Ppx/GppA family phosphatase n=1 Tax=Geminicoccus sp. TaxID=2024832 RepID=UPI002E369762|nr:Ppx/GppA family phosphatase [Geminicoccus sp.]HEX2528438.1 Ppx/GppA family phosphatase [Geminicoccus sp.]
MVDVGSNSVRLVVYDGISRSPVVRFNEKVMCALGKGIERTGRLNEAGVESAVRTLTRFGRLVQGMGVEQLDVCATEASRSATNGQDFIRRAESVLGVPITILTGDEEAYYTALGVRAGFHRPDGLVADLGGGSLEFARIAHGRPGAGVSLPLGTLRLGDKFSGDLGSARKHVDAMLEGIDTFLAPTIGKDLFIVGGGWRAIARVRLAMQNAPLRVLHGYSMPRTEAQQFAKELGRYDPSTLADVPGVPKRRVDTFAQALVLFERVVKATKPRRVVFSAFGVREGRLIRHLSEAEIDQDPLLVAANGIGRAWNRDPGMGEALIRWTDRLFVHEEPEDRRLRHAACHLADIAWRDHPDSRAHMSLMGLSQMPLLALDHAERARLAFTLFTRYDGTVDDPVLTPLLALVGPRERMLAERLGRAMTLGFRLSGAVASILDHAYVIQERHTLVLGLPPGGEAPFGDVVDQRMRALARSMGVAQTHVIEGGPGS